MSQRGKNILFHHLQSVALAAATSLCRDDFANRIPDVTIEDVLVDAYPERLINIHPSLLPRHKGLHTHRRVLEAGELEHGCTVHYVTAELDGGPPVLQSRVTVLEGDDEGLDGDEVEEDSPMEWCSRCKVLPDVCR